MTVRQLFNNKEDEEVRVLALGSFLHMVMDSFNQAHGQRTAGKRRVQKPQTRADRQAGRQPEYMYVSELKNMTDYELQQDHVKGDITVSNHAVSSLKMAFKNSKSKHQTIGYDDSVEVCAEIMKMASAREPWESLREYMDAIFHVEQSAADAETALVQDGGKDVTAEGGKTKKSVRGIPAQGRLFRKKENSIETVVGNYVKTLESLKKKDLGDPVYQSTRTKVKEIKTHTSRYKAYLKTRIGKLNHVMGLEDRATQLRTHETSLEGILRSLEATLAGIPPQLITGKLMEQYTLACNEVRADLLDVQIDLRSIERERMQRAQDERRGQMQRRGGVRVML